MRATIIVALLAVGCHRDSPGSALPPVVDEIEVRLTQLAPTDLPRPSDADLATLAREAVAAVPGPLTYAVAAEPGRPRVLLKVEVELAWIPTKAGVLRALIHAKLTPKREPDGGAVLIDREALVEKDDLAHAPDAAAVRAHLQRAFALTIGGAMRGEQLWLGAPPAAREALASEDGDLKDEAIRIAGERHDRAAVPSLLKLLKTEDAEQRDRVIGALAEIGDQRATKPLAELAKFGDVGELPKILDALSKIGGPEAVSYLEFVVSGHPDPEIKDLAKRALEHLQARTKPTDSAR